MWLYFISFLFGVYFGNFTTRLLKHEIPEDEEEESSSSASSESVKWADLTEDQKREILDRDLEVYFSKKPN
jgi:hypothetical protein